MTDGVTCMSALLCRQFINEKKRNTTILLFVLYIIIYKCI